MGGQDHMKILLLAREAGMNLRRIRYVPFDGGGEAMTSLLGGFVQVCSADASEVLGQWEAGTVRLLAVLAKERMAAPLGRRADDFRARVSGGVGHLERLLRTGGPHRRRARKSGWIG